jgi:hypothetical protein
MVGQVADIADAAPYAGDALRDSESGRRQDAGDP